MIEEKEEEKNEEEEDWEEWEETGSRGGTTSIKKKRDTPVAEQVIPNPI